MAAKDADTASKVHSLNKGLDNCMIGLWAARNCGDKEMFEFYQESALNFMKLMAIHLKKMCPKEVEPIPAPVAVTKEEENTSNWR